MNGEPLFTVLKLRTMRSRCGSRERTGLDPRPRDDRVTRVGRSACAKRESTRRPSSGTSSRARCHSWGPAPSGLNSSRVLSVRYPYFALRDSLKPGVTGWAQIQKGYVNEVEDFEEKLALDIYYMKHRSTIDGPADPLEDSQDGPADEWRVSWWRSTR